MNSSMRSKLKLKIKGKALSYTSNQVTEVFSGFKEGLGRHLILIQTSLKIDLSPLKGYVNETYACLLCFKLIIHMDATPYKYCYGASNPNGYRF